MINNLLTWNPSGTLIAYASLAGNQRRLYLYDVSSELSYPMQIKESSHWFELEFIHDEQLIMHDWNLGFFLYDTEEKRIQALKRDVKSRSFSFMRSEKKLLFQNESDYFMFNPVDRSVSLLMKQSNELLIDPLHQTFIHISSSNVLQIYYKNTCVYQATNAFGIYLSDDFKTLYYFSESANETTVYELNLDTLKLNHQVTIEGLVHNANLSKQLFHVNMVSKTMHYLYIYSQENQALTHITTLAPENAIHSSLSPQGDALAIAKDDESDTLIDLIQL